CGGRSQHPPLARAGTVAARKEASGRDRDHADICLDHFARRHRGLCQSALARIHRFVRRRVSWVRLASRGSPRRPGAALGEMAHEIKQPIAASITSANSCIEWLAHEPPNLDRARAATARIENYGNRVAEIIDRIRSLYKKSPPQRESVDMNGIIHEMRTLLEC